jgi:hypothetical protein
MADTDEEDKIGDIHSPEDLPAQSGNRKTLKILIDIGTYPHEDKNAQRSTKQIELLSSMKNRFK